MQQLYLDVVGVGQEHCETINAHTPACSGWQTVLQCCAEGLINEHGFVITLSFGLTKIQDVNIHTLTVKSSKLQILAQCVKAKGKTHTWACCSKSSLCRTGSFNSV